MQYITLEDTVYLHVNVTDATGAAADGSSAATYVREAGATTSDAPITAGVTAGLLSHATWPDGVYEITIAATAANGFAADKTYRVFFKVTVSAVVTILDVGGFKTQGVRADELTLTGGLSTQAKADINAEMLDVLTVDTFAEPGSVPAATASINDKIGWMAAKSRNKITETATLQSVRDDADAGNIASATIANDGTTTTRGKFA